MIKKNLLKGICLLWLLLAVTPVLQAQDRAQQAFELLDRLIAGQGDSVYVHLDDNILENAFRRDVERTVQAIGTTSR